MAQEPYTGPYADLVTRREEYGNGNQSTFIVKELADIPGGVTIDVEEGGWSSHKVIPAGTGVMYVDGKYVCTNDSADSDSIIGFVKHDMLTSDPRAAVITMGEINYARLPFAYDADSIKGFKFINGPEAGE